MKKISTSALAKKLGIDSLDLIEILEENECIEIKNKGFFSSEKIKVLTEIGEDFGGEMITGTKYGDYIVWPEDFNPLKEFNINTINAKDYINISTLAENFGISPRKLNQIISELGWTEKNIKGWKLTNFGKSLGGIESTHSVSGATFTKWPKNINENISLIKALGINKIEDTSKDENIGNLEEKSFREKFPTQYRTKDGHNVRSRGELVIDNALYEYGLAHAYERKLPVEEDVYSDFYIPAQNGSKAVYIEYWGIEDDKKYENRKNIKKDIYNKYHFNLIELENKHIDNLDDYLPKLLLNFGIRVD